MAQFTEHALRDVVAEYEAGRNAALEKRDARLRAFHAKGWRPVDLQRVTGYSRETIRYALNPEVRRAANENRRTSPAATSVRPPADYSTYGNRKPYMVAESLSELRGPTEDTVTLPQHLDWSGNSTYDLSKPARLASMYRTVLNEATSAEDLSAWIDGQVLIQLWPTLWLPAQLRRLWENRFPELAAHNRTAA
jgi:hypothetical protein